MKRLSLLLLASLVTSTVFADAAHLATQLQKQYPNLNFQNIAPTEMSGMYSAKLDERVVYLDESGQHIFVGSMIRLKDQKNLTQDLSKKAQQKKVNWQQLPFQDAIKIVKGNGQHQLAIFEDPNCPYCQQLETQLEKLNDVTLYIFMYPLRPQSIAPSKRVWCSQNREFAWKNLMQMRFQPKADTYCENPIQRNLALGQKLQLVGTPTLIFKDGSVKVGLLSAQEIQENW